MSPTLVPVDTEGEELFVPSTEGLSELWRGLVLCRFDVEAALGRLRDGRVCGGDSSSGSSSSGIGSSLVSSYSSFSPSGEFSELPVVLLTPSFGAEPAELFVPVASGYTHSRLPFRHPISYDQYYERFHQRQASHTFANRAAFVALRLLSTNP
jgi:hypothetical protein